MVQYTFEFEEEKYSVWVLNGDGEDNKIVPPSHPEFAIRSSAKRLAESEYEKLGFSNSPDLAELMSASRTLVLITDFEKPDAAHQMISIAKGKSTPIERRLLANGINLHLYAPEVEIEAQHINLSTTGPTNTHHNKNIANQVQILGFFLDQSTTHNMQALVAARGSVEFKSFVRSGDSPRGFTPLLSHIVSAHELLLHTQDQVSQEFINRTGYQTMRHEGGSVFAYTRPNYNHGPHGYSPFANYNYFNRDIIAVSFRPSTTRYYEEEMGFTPLYEIKDPDRKGEKTVILRRSVFSFLDQNHLKFFNGREGSILKKGNLTYVKEFEAVDWNAHPSAESAVISYPQHGKAMEKCEELLHKLEDPREKAWLERFKYYAF
ncbi:hypothetical protein GW915_09675 [bacterium]|nr:hypothetical protein [bacterium]